jgi:hypothetical protein
MSKKEEDEFKSRISELKADPNRYVFTHHILRDWVLEDCDEITGICHFISKGEMPNKFPEFWVNMGGDKDALSAGVFEPMFYKIEDNRFLVAMRMPTPKLVNEASWIAFEGIVGRDFYTLEKTKDRGYAFCKWSEGVEGHPEHYYIKDGLEGTLEDFLITLKESL